MAYHPKRAAGGRRRSSVPPSKILVTFLLLLVIVGVIILVVFAFSHQGGDKPGEGGPVPSDSSEPSVSPTPDPEALLAEAKKLSAGYFYQEALEKLAPLGEDARALELKQEIESAKAALVPYTGKVYHVFFHSLILDPALAFDDKGHPAEGYNEWMTTRYEFEKMLPLMLQNGFVLYDIEDLVDFSTGEAKPREILLPPGKKPLVLSIDDVCYYDYMKPDGFADRLDVDGEGRVVTVVKNEDGTEEKTYDGDVMPITDAFVAEHPEFSWRGAKGIVAVTGYQGAFGYRITDLEQFSQAEGEQMLQKVQDVAAALRGSGWRIASHSYTHNAYWNGTMTLEEMKSDTDRWWKLIGTYVGETNIFISPFGARFDLDDERFRYLMDSGFDIYCPVGADMSSSYSGDVFLMDRLNLDGYTMVKHPDRITSVGLFDPAQVVDPARPPMS